MEVSQESFDRFQAATKALQEKADEAVRDLATATEQLDTMSKLMKQATEDMSLLLAFIKSKGLQPPTIQSKFIN